MLFLGKAIASTITNAQPFGHGDAKQVEQRLSNKHTIIMVVPLVKLPNQRLYTISKSNVLFGVCSGGEVKRESKRG